MLLLRKSPNTYNSGDYNAWFVVPDGDVSLGNVYDSVADSYGI